MVLFLLSFHYLPLTTQEHMLIVLEVAMFPIKLMLLSSLHYIGYKNVILYSSMSSTVLVSLSFISSLVNFYKVAKLCSHDEVVVRDLLSHVNSSIVI